MGANFMEQVYKNYALAQSIGSISTTLWGIPDAASQTEALARRQIDELLEASGWTVQVQVGS